MKGILPGVKAKGLVFVEFSFCGKHFFLATLCHGNVEFSVEKSRALGFLDVPRL